MSERQFFRLVHPTARQMASRACINAPQGHVVEIKPPTRSLDQNAKFHALCGDVACQAQHMGRTLTPLQWKCLFVSGHAIATEMGTEIVPGLEGEFVNIRESTAAMGVKRKASLIEYVLAWGTENDVKWSDPADQGYDDIRGGA